MSPPDKELAMTRSDLTEKLLDIKREKGWTWKTICAEIGGMSPILVTGAILGQHKSTKPQAAKAAALFGLSKSEQALINEVPMRGTATPMPPTDGPALKVLIEEEFGDGIMGETTSTWTSCARATPKATASSSA
jgi:cyanate lyase